MCIWIYHFHFAKMFSTAALQKYSSAKNIFNAINNCVYISATKLQRHKNTLSGKILNIPIRFQALKIPRGSHGI